MLKTLFEQGMTFEDFMNLENGKHKDIMKSFSSIDAISKELKDQILKVEKKIKILVFGEVLCPDCVINVSALEKLHLVNNKVEFMIVGRDGNEDTIKIYGDKDKSYIPTFVIMDEEYNVLGNFIERPISIKKLSDEKDQVKRILMMKNYRKGEYIDETIWEILKKI
ncbi:MAG: thioredoxin family protein [Acidaminobacteraceae bacterium]